MAYNSWNSNSDRPNNNQAGGWQGSGELLPLDDSQRSSQPAGIQPQPPVYGQPPPGYPGRFGAPPGQLPYPGQPARPGDFQQRVIPALSPEDLVILRECGQESLLYRCKYLAFPLLNTNLIPTFELQEFILNIYTLYL